MGEAALEVDPELGHVLPAGAEVGEDALHHVDAPRRVAVLDEPAEDRLGPLEDAVLALAEEADAVVRVHEGDVHRQRGEDGLELLEAQDAGGEDDAPLADRLRHALASRRARRPRDGERDGARAGGEGREGDAGPGSLGARGFGHVARGGRRRVALARVDEAVAEPGGLGEDLAPLGRGEGLERHGEEDALLLEDHLLDRGERGNGDGPGHELPLPGRASRLREGVPELPQERPRLVVLAPHDGRGPGDPVPLQEREEEILLPLVVLLDVHEAGEEAAAHEVVRGVDRGVLADTPRRERGERGAQGRDLGAQRLVLPAKGVDGVAGGRGSARLLDQDVAHDLRVQVAHPHDLLHGHALGHELLLHGRDLARVALAHEGAEARLHFVRGLSLVKVADHLLEGADAVRAVVDELAHARPRAPRDPEEDEMPFHLAPGAPSGV